MLKKRSSGSSCWECSTGAVAICVLQLRTRFLIQGGPIVLRSFTYRVVSSAVLAASLAGYFERHEERRLNDAVENGLAPRANRPPPSEQTDH